MSTLEVISSERAKLADLLDTLTPEQLQTPSLCGDWSVQQVAGHLLMPLVTPLRVIIGGVLVARGSFDAANDRISRKFSERPAAQIAAGLRAQADNRFHPPGFGMDAPLAELLIHGQDIRRPLGLALDFPAAETPVALDMLISPKAARGFVTRRRLAGLSFEATDVDWSGGRGDLVRGPAASIAYAMAGRAVALTELTGPGVEVLRAR